MRPANQPGIPAWHGDALRLRRLAGGWTCRQLAERVCVSKTTLLRWETNSNTPTAEQVQELARVLGVAVHAFSKTPRIV